MLIIDKNYTIESVSEASLEILKTSRDQLIGARCYRIVHSKDAPPGFCPLLEANASGLDAARYGELCRELAANRLTVRCTALCSDDGSVLRVLGATDIKEQTTALQEMAGESDYRLEEVLDSVPTALMVTDVVGLITQANRAAVRSFGFSSREEMRGRALYELIAPSHRQRFQPVWQSTLTDGKHEYGEMTFLRSDGRAFPGSFSTTALKDSTGMNVGIIVSLRDLAIWKQLQEALKFSDLVLNTVKECVIAWDKDYNIVYWNEASERVYGIPASEAIGRKLGEVFEITQHFDSGDAQPLSVDNIAHFHGETFVRTRAASVWVENEILSVGRNGEQHGFVSVARDVGERRKMAEHISVLDSAVASAINGICLVDTNGLITYANDSFLALWGYADRAEVVGRPLLDFWQPGNGTDDAVRIMQQVGHWTGELAGKKRDGTLFSVKVTGHSVKGKDGQLICFMASFIDVTEERKSHEALKESETFVASLLQNSHHPILVINPDTSIRYANSSFEKLTGFAMNELVGRRAPYPWMVRESLPRTAREFRLAMRRGPKWYEELYRKKNGKHFWVEVTSAPVMKDNVLYYYMLSWVDITDRRLIEEELTKERDRQRTYLDTVGVMVATVDAHGRITMVNKKACETLGYGERELVGQNWYNVLVPQRSRTDIKRTFRGMLARNSPNGAKHSEGVLITKAGDEKLFTFTHTVLTVPGRKSAQILISGEDTTELRKTQEQLEHSHLLASLGEMTAGIAHEVNNPLGSILLYSELLMSTDVPPQIKKDLKVIHDEAKRATRVMTDLLTYGRRTKPQVRRVNMSSIIRKVLDMRRYQHKVQNIGVNADQVDSTVYVKGDASQLMQVVMNLILNAEDAVREHKGGNITVVCRAEPRWAKIQVIDDGPGIPDDYINQIFYPFFTTKPVGEGTGLGLSICYGIVTAHGGLIRAENNSKGGATFTIELPLANGRTGSNGHGGTDARAGESVTVTPQVSKN